MNDSIGNLEETNGDDTEEWTKSPSDGSEHENSAPNGGDESNDNELQRFIRQMESVRRNLLGGNSNSRLIHTNRKDTMNNALNLLDEQSDTVFEMLRTENKALGFKFKEGDIKNEKNTLPKSSELDEMEQIRTDRTNSPSLKTSLDAEKLQRRLLKLSIDSKTAESEQGINLLFLAIGFLKWFEIDNPNKIRESPLILVPVEIIRTGKGKGSNFKIKYREDEITANLLLQDKLKEENIGVNIPDIDDTDDWQPWEYFEQVKEAISDKKGWEIEENGMQLGFFSFSKLLMYKDLDSKSWPDNGLFNNKIIQGLLHSNFESIPPLFSNDENLDERLDPSDIIHVLDADSSQTKVIEEVRKGRNLIVQGPPGTGKSQTIANIIASAVHDGKRVLFMAEKMAALEVVGKRLDEVGLGDICLELHSKDANKKNVINVLEKTIKLENSGKKKSLPNEKIKLLRDQLNHATKQLHQEVPKCGYTPYSVMGEISKFIGNNNDIPNLENTKFHMWTDEDRKIRNESLKSFIDHLKLSGPRHEHPFFGTSAKNLEPIDLKRLETELKKCLETLEKFVSLSETTAKELGNLEIRAFADVDKMNDMLKFSGKVPVGSETIASILFRNQNRNELREMLKNIKKWYDSEYIIKIFQKAIWTKDVSEMRSNILKGVQSTLIRIFGKYRSASKEFSSLMVSGSNVPKRPQEQLSLLDNVISLQKIWEKVQQDEPTLKSIFGSEWKGKSTNFSEVISVMEWINNVTEEYKDLNIETVQGLIAIVDGEGQSEKIKEVKKQAIQDMDTVINRLGIEFEDGTELRDGQFEDLKIYFDRILNSIDRYEEWNKLVRHVNELDENGLSELRSKLESGELESDKANIEFNYSVADARWNHIISLFGEELEKVKEMDRNQISSDFCDIDRKKFEAVRELIKFNHIAGLPKDPKSDQMKFLNREIAKKKRHAPIRKLVLETADILQKIKPVFLMSPISIAKFLPPGSLEFDLMVIDEASQVRPEDAFGAIARSHQIVVVGDKQQLPPTSFFERITSTDYVEDEDEMESAPVSDIESILTLVEASGIRSMMLEFHYRSRHPSLIYISNDEFYDGDLKLPPSPICDGESLGLKFQFVPGVYTSKTQGDGRPGTNKIEATYVVDALCEHIQNEPEYSIGIVAFSKSQSDMIAEVLEYRRKENKDLDEFLRSNEHDEVFVKNIENVQGDERDVILISVGYGPHAPEQGLPSMNFGPINREGGERRLNVLFTRARIRWHVFASFKPEDMKIRSKKSIQIGPKVLWRYLDFAESGQYRNEIFIGGYPDSEFEEDVAREIMNLGYELDYQVGSGGFRIDIGVRLPSKPGRYILAVECDGATYHGGLSAQERDRMRQEILEDLGWKFHRIWSTDWYYRRPKSIEHLKKALEVAAQELSS